MLRGVESPQSGSGTKVSLVKTSHTQQCIIKLKIIYLSLNFSGFLLVSCYIGKKHKCFFYLFIFSHFCLGHIGQSLLNVKILN